MEDGMKYDSTHKYWALAVERIDPGEDPSELCRVCDILDESDARQAEHRARQAAGLEPPDPYIEEDMPPLPDPDPEEVKEVADRLCWLLKGSQNEELQRLGKQIRTTIWGDGRPAHRPPSSSIAKRDKWIVEQIEYRRRQREQIKAILPVIAKQFCLSQRG
jgi:hypothetical protein